VISYSKLKAELDLWQKSW